MESSTGFPGNTGQVPNIVAPLAEMLRLNGYSTGAFGKWGLGAPGSVSDPAEHFDSFYGYNCQREAHSYYPNHLWKNFEKIELDGKTYAHDPIMNEALNFVKANKDDPFFLFLPVTIPHAAMHVPEKYAAPFRKKFPQFEDKIGKYSGPKVKNPIAAFAGMMMAPLTLVDTGMSMFGIKAFAGAVVGGFGSIPGALLGCLIIGISEPFLDYAFPPLKGVYAYIIMFGVLLVKPEGLISQTFSKKV